MTQQQIPDLTSGASAQEIQNFVPRITKDKNLHELILCAGEASAVAQALSFAALNTDPHSHQAKIGGIIAGLTRIIQRLESRQAET